MSGEPSASSGRPGTDTERPVRVLIVDDQKPFATAAAAVVRRISGFSVVGMCESGEQALAELDGTAPDLVILDVQMPGMGGIAAGHELLRRAPYLVLVLCSTYPAEDLPIPDGWNFLPKFDLTPTALTRLWETRRGPE